MNTKPMVSWVAASFLGVVLLVGGFFLGRTLSPTATLSGVGTGPVSGMMSGEPLSGMMTLNGTRRSNTPLSVAEAKAAASQYLTRVGTPELVIDEIMVFDNNAYVAIKDTKTGTGAFEVLVDPVTKAVFPEYGPNMMWNTTYRMMGNGNSVMDGNTGMMGGGNTGMMGNGGSTRGARTPLPSDGPLTVTPEKALSIAQTSLDQVFPGTKAATKADAYPGYYTIDFQRDGTITGMLSVNGYSGQVWYHTWHGLFIEMADYGA